MPIYEYKCDECGTAYEQLRRMSDADRDLECPSCHSDQIRRLLSSFAAHGSSSSSDFQMAGCGKPQCGMTSGRFT